MRNIEGFRDSGGDVEFTNLLPLFRVLAAVRQADILRHAETDEIA